MLIWTRFGILALVLPLTLALVAENILRPAPYEAVAAASELENADPRPKQSDDVANSIEKARYEDHQRTVARLRSLGYGIGFLAAGAGLWILGRWIIRCEVLRIADPRTGAVVELKCAAEDTLFKIPMQYWGIIWALIGVYKLMG